MNNKSKEIYDVCKDNWIKGYKRSKGFEVAKNTFPFLTEDVYSSIFRDMMYCELGISSLRV